MRATPVSILATSNGKESLDEVAEILAAGLQRLHARQSSALPAHSGDSSLDCAAGQSGHANVLNDGDGRGG